MQNSEEERLVELVRNAYKNKLPLGLFIHFDGQGGFKFKADLGNEAVINLLMKENNQKQNSGKAFSASARN